MQRFCNCCVDQPTNIITDWEEDERLERLDTLVNLLHYFVSWQISK